MNYKITKLEKSGSGMGVAELTVTFDDGSKYNKRMMVNLASEETVHADIQQWMADYIEAKAAESNLDLSELVNKTTMLAVEDLPKSSRVKSEEQEAAKAAAKAAPSEAPDA